MNLVTHQFKKDVRHFRLLLIVWFFLILLQSVSSQLEIGAGNTANNLFFQTIAILVPLLQWIVLVAFVPLLVHDEPLVGSTAFWFTRPITRKTILATKTLFTVLLLIILPFLAEIATLVHSGTLPRHIFLAIPEVLISKISFILPVLLLAALTQSLATFVLAGVISFVFIYLISIGFFFLHLEKMMTTVRSLTSSKQVVCSILTVTFGSGLVIHQYLTRKTIRTIIFTAAALVIISAARYLWPLDFLKGKTAPLDKMITTESINLTPAGSVYMQDFPEMFGRHKKEPSKQARFNINVLGMPPGYFARIKELGSSKITFSDNNTVALESGEGRYSSESVWGTTKALQEILGNVRLVNVYSPKKGENSTIAQIRIKDVDYNKYVKEKGIFSANALFDAFKYEIVAELPLKKGTHYDTGSKHTLITDVLNETSGCTIILKERNVNLLFDTETYKTGLSSYFTSTPTMGIYILQNKKRQEAFLPKDNYDVNPFEMMRGGPLKFYNSKLHYTSIDTTTSNQIILPEIDSKWLADADLVLVKAVPAGEFRHPLQIDGFSFTEKNLSSSKR